MAADPHAKFSSIFSVLYIDGNTLRYWFVLALCYYVTGSFIGTLFLSIVAGIVLDFGYYVLGLCFYDSEIVISRGYNASSYFNDTLHSEGIDYGFNFYNGDYKKKPEVAQIDKFKFAIEKMGIKEGDRVLDIGCGCGDWLYYLQTVMKCKVAGVNITKAQADECRSRGLNVYTSNWKDIKNNPKLRKALYGQFDFVSFWDTVEHYVSMPEGVSLRGGRKVRGGIYQDMFKLAQLCMDPKTIDTKHRVWISCIHVRREFFNWNDGLAKMFNPENMTKQLYVYLLDKFHSGFYPSYYKCQRDGKFYDELVDNAKETGLNLKYRKDVTYDYYMTSVLEPTHFGRHRFKLTPQRMVALLMYPFLDSFWIHRVAWFWMESWMNQFDSKEIDQSDTILWWLVFTKQTVDKPVVESYK